MVWRGVGELAMSHERQSKKSILEKAKTKFGLTEDVLEAGYVLGDGSMLNFSGGSEGERNLDHTEVIELYGKYIGSGHESKYVSIFQREVNAMRISESEGSLSIQLNIVQNPTDAQWLKIGRLLRDGGGDLYFDIYNKTGKKVIDAGKTRSLCEVRAKMEYLVLNPRYSSVIDY